MFDDGENISDYIDWSKATRPGLKPRRVNVDFPAWMVRSLDAAGAKARRDAAGVDQDVAGGSAGGGGLIGIHVLYCEGAYEKAELFEMARSNN